MKIEVIPLMMNVGICVYYLWQWQEPGKAIYWGGASVLTLGLLFMKG